MHPDRRSELSTLAANLRAQRGEIDRLQERDGYSAPLGIAGIHVSEALDSLAEALSLAPTTTTFVRER